MSLFRAGLTPAEAPQSRNTGAGKPGQMFWSIVQMTKPLLIEKHFVPVY